MKEIAATVVSPMVAALSSTLDPQGLADSLVPVSLTASEVPALEPPQSAETATKPGSPTAARECSNVAIIAMNKYQYSNVIAM